MEERNDDEFKLPEIVGQTSTEQSATEQAPANPDAVSVEYSCNLQQYKRMHARINRKATILYAVVVISFIAVVFGVLIALADEWTLQLAAAVMFVVLATVFALSMRKGVRTQAEKNFAMYSKNGIARERIEIVGNSLDVTNLGTDSHVRLDRASITSVQNYGDFFVIRLNIGTSKPVPLTEQTRLLYNALTDSAAFDRAAAAHPSSEPSQPLERPTDVLSFEYELTREQSAHIMRSYGRSKTVPSFVLACSCLILAAFMLKMAIVDRDNVKNVAVYSVLATILFAIGILLIVLYAVGMKNSARNGANYFDINSLDGKMVQRIELSQQGIVTVNVLKDYRTNFRLADMTKIRRGKDYFVVEFISNQVLPLPFGTETAQLYDLLAKI